MATGTNLKVVEAQQLNEATAETGVANGKRRMQKFRPVATIVSDEEVAGLRMPISTFITEAEDLLSTSHVFAGELLGVGMKVDMLRQFEDLLDAVRTCHTIVTIERTRDDGAEVDAVLTRARRMRADLLEAAELAFFADGVAMAQFDAVRSQGVDDDLRGVLLQLATLVAQHGPALRRVRIDPEATLVELQALADAVLATRAELRLERADGTWKDLRDRLCVITSAVVAEVRAHGTYAFRAEEGRRQLFLSRWIRARSRKQRLAAKAREQEKKTPEQPAPAEPVRTPVPPVPDWEARAIEI